MRGRTVLVAYTAGVAAVQTLAVLPDRSTVAGALVIAVACALLAWRDRRQSRRAWMLCVVAAMLAGSGLAAARAHLRLGDVLACEHRDRVQRLEVTIVGLATGDAQRRRALVDVSADRPRGVPARIVVSWHAPFGSNTALPEWVPGQRWRMALLLRPPRGLMNPIGRDAEASMFAQGVRAVGRVRGKPVLLAEHTAGRLDIKVQRLRHTLRQRMLVHLGDAPHAGLIVALALGDQSAITHSDRQVLNRSGIAHLVAISGLHIGWVAGLAAGVTAILYRRVTWPARWTRRRSAYAAGSYIPAQSVAAVVAWLAAAAYCSLAGWGIPARRVFIMLTVFMGAIVCRLPCGSWRALAVAAALVVTADPWAPVSAGFWLSFAAVAAILAVVRPGISSQSVKAAPDPAYRDHPDFLYADPPPTRLDHWREQLTGRLLRLGKGVVEAGRVQWMLTLALAPLLAVGLGNVSLVSPLANALAIPAMGALGTPLTLVFSISSLLAPAALATAWLGAGAHGIVAATLVPVAWLAQWPNAQWSVASVPAGVTVLAIAGTIYALLPRGLPWRRTAWMSMLPFMLAGPRAMSAGEWRLVALDIGQGGAVAVLTAGHTIVFDSGLMFGDGSDSGGRVIAPYLLSVGRRRIDRLIISHRHADHFGGVRGLSAALPIRFSHAPYDLNAAQPAPAGAPLAFQRCEAGLGWTYDDVRFTFIHPPPGRIYTQAQANASSCVMLIEGKHHRAVLTGDIGAREERSLSASIGRVHVALAAHHGSASSSSQAWVDALGAWHAIAQNGYRNRFNHPAPAVQRRWRDAHAAFWRNDLDGAIQADSRSSGLHVVAWRDLRKRYWHEALTSTAEEVCGLDSTRGSVVPSRS